MTGAPAWCSSTSLMCCSDRRECKFFLGERSLTVSIQTRQEPPRFDYDEAFSRNLGWTTEWEQATLRRKKIAVAGMGGVGAIHLLTLARLGIGAFSIADFDSYSLVNMNRQAGANMHTLGRQKVEVAAQMALEINPEILLTRFPEGVTTENLDAFLQDCDLFVDGLDFFALDIRAAVFRRCDELGIPAFTAAPIGMGVGFLAFLPGKMKFEDYFRLQGQPESERYLRFLLGMAPRGLHRIYLADDTRVDLKGKRGPSTAAACALCAGVVATQAVKILLGRGGVPHAPVHLHFDAYRGILAKSSLRWGNCGPLQRIKLALGRKSFAAMSARSTPDLAEAEPQALLPFEAPEMLAILNLARWSPSGDNEQPWKIEIVDAMTLVVHLAERSPSNLYEYRNGEPSILASGMLLESIRVAATVYGYAVDWILEPDGPPWKVGVRLQANRDIAISPLAAALPMRSVSRKAFRRRSLNLTERNMLADTLGNELEITWHRGFCGRMRFARMGSLATDIRLRCKDTFDIHRKVVDWDRERSPSGLPSKAIGLNGATLLLMRWASRNWDRMARVNSLLGTWGAAAQLDVWPALNSSAFFVVKEMSPPRTSLQGAAMTSRLLATGERLQRFWLTATKLGLVIQPTLAILAFAEYGATGYAFTDDGKLLRQAANLAYQAGTILGPLDTVRFLGRIGGRVDGMPGARSVRKPLADLLWDAPAKKIRRSDGPGPSAQTTGAPTS